MNSLASFHVQLYNPLLYSCPFSRRAARLGQSCSPLCTHAFTRIQTTPPQDLEDGVVKGHALQKTHTCMRTIIDTQNLNLNTPQLFRHLLTQALWSVPKWDVEVTSSQQGVLSKFEK